MLFELDGERLHFQAISRAGKTIDAGILTRREVKQNAATSKAAASK